MKEFLEEALGAEMASYLAYEEKRIWCKSPNDGSEKERLKKYSPPIYT